MEELNKATLQKALAKMPEYAPQPELWGRIERELQHKEALRKLPEYAPPPDVWEGIQAALENKPRAKARILALNWRSMAAAAVVAGLSFGLAWWWFNADAPERVAMSYAQEQGALLETPQTDPEDEAAFEEIPRQFAAIYEGQNTPLAQELQSSLEELNGAVADIRDVLDQYGADPELVQELTVVERERTDVLKQMAAML